MARIPARTSLPFFFTTLGLLAAAPVCGQQCPSDSWQLFAATGDGVEIETVGEIAWIAAVGGMIRVDLTGVAGGSPAQFKITDIEGLVSTDLSCMTVDGFGNVWVGTREDGVSVFDAAGNHIDDVFTFDEKLWSDRVLAMNAAKSVVTGTDGEVEGLKRPPRAARRKGT